MLSKTNQTIKERDKGFTLIELLVVIIIIGILAAIAIPIFLNQRKKAVEASVISDVKNIASALEAAQVANPNRGQLVLVDALDNGAVITGDNQMYVVGNSLTGYCIMGWQPNASTSTSPQSPMTYDSTAGGLRKTGGACTPAALAEAAGGEGEG